MGNADGFHLILTVLSLSLITGSHQDRIVNGCTQLDGTNNNTAMVIGEAPLMKDLQDTTDADLVRVNVISIGAIFLIIMIIFKSISLPIILVAVLSYFFTILSISASWAFTSSVAEPYSEHTNASSY